jgi:hypothetical protein
MHAADAVETLFSDAVTTLCHRKPLFALATRIEWFSVGTVLRTAMAYLWARDQLEWMGAAPGGIAALAGPEPYPLKDCVPGDDEGQVWSALDAAAASPRPCATAVVWEHALKLALAVPSQCQAAADLVHELLSGVHLQRYLHLYPLEAHWVLGAMGGLHVAMRKAPREGWEAWWGTGDADGAHRDLLTRALVSVEIEAGAKAAAAYHARVTTWVSTPPREFPRHVGVLAAFDLPMPVDVFREAAM